MNHFARLLILTLLFTAACSHDPGTALAEPAVSNINVVFVIDVSGSMSERGKIAKTRDALQKTLALLPNDSNVGIVVFNSSVDWLVPIGKLNRIAIGTKMNAVKADGKTAIGDALVVAANGLIAHRDRLKQQVPQATYQIVMMTDGELTAGSDPAEVIPQIVQRQLALDVISVEEKNVKLARTLAENRLSSHFHQIDQAEKLFQTFKKVLNLEAVTPSSGDRIGDLELLEPYTVDEVDAARRAIIRLALPQFTTGR